MSDDTYPMPKHGWTCFHCGEHFPGTHHGARAAREHFGGDPEMKPGCIMRIPNGERSLLERIRDLEQENFVLASTIASYAEEDGPKDREIAKLKGEHRIALQAEEEKGYARGLADARKEMGALT